MYELIGFLGCEVETLATDSELEGKAMAASLEPCPRYRMEWAVEAQEGSVAQIEGVFGSAAGKETAAQSLVLK